MSSYPIDQSPSKLIASLQDGDERAAFELHERYAKRLLMLVRTRMNPTFRRRMDPEDVVQSAFRSFFRVVSDDRWNSQGRAEKVWSLLAAITLNKLNARMRYHLAGKRSVNLEDPEVDSLIDRSMPETESLFVDELQWVMCHNIESHQRILEMLLSGYDEQQVAQANDCTMRTVYRVAERALQQLRSRLGR